MKVKKISKVILIYAVFIYCGILLNNVIQDKNFYNEIIDIFTRYDYRAINFVFLVYNMCLGLYIYTLIKIIIKIFKRNKGEENEIN